MTVSIEALHAPVWPLSKVDHPISRTSEMVVHVATFCKRSDSKLPSNKVFFFLKTKIVRVMRIMEALLP